MGGFTTAVMQHNNSFHLFDSHRRDMRQLSNADDASVLSKFTSLLEVESYIQVEYLNILSCFQVQFVNIHRSSCVGILSHYQRFY